MSKEKKSKQKKTAKTIVVATLKGKIDITRSGMGYVIVDNNAIDIMVRPSDMSNALHGDIVRVKVTRENGRTGKKEGKVVEVVERRQTEFIGHIQLSDKFAFFVPDTDKPMPDIFIPLQYLNGAKNKDRVSAKLVKWDKDDKKPVGEVTAIMSPEDENDAAMKELLAQAGFPLFFPQDVLEAAAELPVVLDEAEIAKRRDCRDIKTFTIDPVDAKDFDDALSIRKLPSGLYEIGVHIADVSYYVLPDTDLDAEAYKRATSVYLPDRVNPMLPEKISNELCSLRPNEDKFTFSAIFQINDEAHVKQYWLGRTVIHSDKRYAYEDVQTIIDTSEGENVEDILLLHNLAQKFRQARFKKGAINFSSQEVRFTLDENAKPIGITVKESKPAHQLIEEFMLLANKTVAENISKIQINKQALPFPYRIHDQPDPEKLAPFVQYAKKYGHGFDASSPEKISASFNQLLEDAKGKPEQHVLEQLGIRTMAKAVYSTQNIGHYGLAFDFYCHFTSPIRRYPDILVHRVLQTVLDNKPVVDKKMEEKCKQSSDRERAAMECERASNKYKQVEYMRDYIGDTFEGVVSGVSSFGFWVETLAHKCEGLVSIVGLSEFDDFRHIESDYSLVGKRSGRSFKMGDKVFIKVIAANLDKRQLDYEWVQVP
ncbi:MAG: ribonuclease R [Bacteroidota bacterium]|jgi:ribonuclease R